MLGRILKCRNFIFVKSVAQSDSDGLSSYLARKPIAVFVVRICDFSLKINFTQNRRVHTFSKRVWNKIFS